MPTMRERADRYADAGDILSHVFKDYVTSAAFSLSLSRSMCEAMEFVLSDSLVNGMRTMGTIPGLMTIHSLNRRGLVLNNGKCWTLTDAGKLVYPMLVMAGLCRSEDEIRASAKAA